MRLRPALLLVLAAGCGGSDAPSAASLGEGVDRAVAELAITGAAMGAAFHDTGEVMTAASGVANVATGETWTADRQFRIGSVTKTFTAAVVFQLIDEGVVSLDDPLERWVPGYYDGVNVQVRHLLGNTSGIVSYNYVGSFDDTRPWTPQELVEWAVMNESTLRFEPGERWEYSNTNYILLGLVIEAATGATYEQAVQKRILDPLGLDDTYVAKSGDANPNIVRAYDKSGAEVVIDPSFGWAAGSIVSTPADLAKWGAALFGGDVVSDASLTMMITPTSVSGADGYGHGVFVEIDEENAIYGHTGGIGGFLTYMYFWRDEKVALVAVSNQLEVNLRDLSAYGWSVVLGSD